MDDEVPQGLSLADAYGADVYVARRHKYTANAAHERASHAARLRMELSQSAHEQRDYLKKVERARVKRAKAERGEPEPAVGGDHAYQQRTPVFRDVRDQRARGAPAPTAASGTMESVLDKIF